MKTRTMLAFFFLVGGLPAIAPALTVDEVLLLKENGVSEKTIQRMIESETRASAAKTKAPPLGIGTIVRPDGHPAIIYSTGSSDKESFNAEERRKEEQAWKMLRRLIVDTRNQ